MSALAARTRPSLAAAFLVAVIAGVHFQQYVDFISHVPTVGILFLLNAAGGAAAAIAIALLSRDRLLVTLAAAVGLALASGSLVCLTISLTGSFAGFHEPTLRLPIVIAILADIAALPPLTLLVKVGGTSMKPRLPSATS